MREPAGATSSRSTSPNRVRVDSARGEYFRPAFPSVGVQAQSLGNRLDQRRLARTVVAHQERHRGGEPQRGPSSSSCATAGTVHGHRDHCAVSTTLART